MDKTKEIEYIPFNAVNEFMRDDYRLTILQEVLVGMDQCTPAQKQLITRFISKGVQIPGFRNSSMAPVKMKVKNSTSLFERSAEFSATVMECWSNLHPELKKATGVMLKEKQWEIDEIELDRSQLPGFRIDWPKEDTFEALIKVIRETNPDLNESEDNISLMAVWVGNRLPYNLYSGTDSEKS